MSGAFRVDRRRWVCPFGYVIYERMFVDSGDDAQRVSDGQLEDEICLMAGHLSAALARWLALVAEYDRRAGWATWGCRSCAQWLAWRCGISPVTAREQLRVAHALNELPAIAGEFAVGRLSYSQVRALTRAATQDMEGALLELARHCTAAQLDRLVRGYRTAAAQTEEARDAHEQREVLWWQDGGSLVIHARLPLAEGETVLQALRATRDQLRDTRTDDSAEAPNPSPASLDDSAEARSPTSSTLDDSAEARAASSADLPEAAGPPGDDSVPPPGDPPPRAVMADALVAVAHRSLAVEETPISGAERRQLVVHVDLETLAHDTPGSCETGDGHAISPETARRLGCDSALIPIRRRDGRPLSVGRRTRALPAHLRRALHARDRECRFPGCHQRHHLDAHHLHHWAHGGLTALTNLTLLCHHHHTLLHEGGYTVTSAAGGRLTFHRPDGEPIHDVPRRPPGDPYAVPRDNIRHGHTITPDTPVTSWNGDPLDLPLTTELLLHQRVRA